MDIIGARVKKDMMKASTLEAASKPVSETPPVKQVMIRLPKASYPQACITRKPRNIIRGNYYEGRGMISRRPFRWVRQRKAG